MKNIYLAEIDPNTNNKKIINRSPFNSVKEAQNAAKRALRNKKLEKNIYGIIKVDSLFYNLFCLLYPTLLCASLAICEVSPIRHNRQNLPSDFVP